MPLHRTLAICTAMIGVAVSCGGPDTAATPGAPVVETTSTSTSERAASPDPLWPTDLGDGHQEWGIEIIRTIPHDETAFTQGLERTQEGILESTGRRGESSLRLIDADTGEVVRSRDLSDQYFAEGLTVVDDQVVQLTWTSGVALRYDLATFEPREPFEYAGEGWGLCFDGSDLWMSDGSSRLTSRDPDTFEERGQVTVRLAGVAVERLNELECVAGRVLANVWQRDEIVVIDPSAGTVDATIDASALAASLDLPGILDRTAVLNGIADLGDGTLLLTGKLWPESFVVRLVG